MCSHKSEVSSSYDMSEQEGTFYQKLYTPSGMCICTNWEVCATKRNGTPNQEINGMNAIKAFPHVPATMPESRNALKTRRVRREERARGSRPYDEDMIFCKRSGKRFMR